MNRKTRNLLRIIAIVIVGICTLMKLDIVEIPALSPHVFWLMLISFVTVLLVSK
ncbi:MAG: hypothetical protein AAFQ98_23560 [Bacteroidota bacterium]